MTGFGAPLVRYLEFNPIPWHHWLTVEVAEREFAIREYEMNKVQLAMDSIQEAI